VSTRLTAILVFVEKRYPPIVHQVGSGERGLAIVELGKRYLRIGVDRRLPVDRPHALTTTSLISFDQIPTATDQSRRMVWTLMELAASSIVIAFVTAAAYRGATTATMPAPRISSGRPGVAQSGYPAYLKLLLRHEPEPVNAVQAGRQYGARSRTQ
jgi:hypothetical protein